MRKLNKTIATVAVVAFITLLLSACHRNTCPTFGDANQDTEERA